MYNFIRDGDARKENRLHRIGRQKGNEKEDKTTMTSGFSEQYKLFDTNMLKDICDYKGVIELLNRLPGLAPEETIFVLGTFVIATDAVVGKKLLTFVAKHTDNELLKGYAVTFLEQFQKEDQTAMIASDYGKGEFED